MFVWKDENKQKGAKDGPFKKTLDGGVNRNGIKIQNIFNKCEAMV